MQVGSEEAVNEIWLPNLRGEGWEKATTGRTPWRMVTCTIRRSGIARFKKNVDRVFTHAQTKGGGGSKNRNLINGT